MTFSFLKSPFVILVVALAANVLFAAFYLPAQARKQWETVREELLARGEKLEMEDFAVQYVEDERNFFADPLWRELSNREAVTHNGVTYHKSRTKAEEWKISVLSKRIEGEEKTALEAKYPEFQPLGDEVHRYKLLSKFWEKARREGNTQRAAEFVLEVLAPAAPVIARLRELGGRPDAYYPLEYGEGAMMSVEHLLPLLSASQWLDLHESVLLSQGRSGEAFDDVQLLFRLAGALNREQVIIVVLTEINILKTGLAAVNRGIKTHAWNEDQLLEFDKMLAKIDVAARLAGGLRAERAVMLEFLPLIEKQVWETVSSLRGPEEKTADKKVLMRPILGLYPVYWMPADKAFYAQAIQKWAEALDEAPRKGLRAEFFPDPLEAAQANRSGWSKVQFLLSHLMLRSLSGIFFLGAHLQADVLQTRVAIALERFRIKNGDYPDELSALVPEFLPVLPVDPVTMGPFHYVREQDEKFRLWSVGWNETDEGGKAGKKRTEADWVWGQ